MEIKVDVNFFLPEEYKETFDAEKLEDKGDYYILTVLEKNNQTPKQLHGKQVVSNGFKEKLEIVHHPTNAKLMYLHFYRRRWKEIGTKESFSNTYKLHPNGAKITKEFGDFLKGLARQERDKLFTAVKGLKAVWEENKHLV